MVQVTLQNEDGGQLIHHLAPAPTAHVRLNQHHGRTNVSKAGPGIMPAPFVLMVALSRRPRSTAPCALR